MNILAQPTVPAIRGTWDFKWPRGTKIRVAFQQTVADWGFPDIGLLMKHFECHVGLWKIQDTNLSIEFVRELLPAPAPVNGKTATLWHARSSLSEDCGHHPSVIDYDILVSFARLPAFVRPPGSSTMETVSAQSSVLGSYALRLGYGIPTMFVGPHESLCKTPQDASDYFLGRDKIFQFIVCHEMGHALGLAHEHQNPYYRTMHGIRPGMVQPARVEAVLRHVGGPLRSLSMRGSTGSDLNVQPFKQPLSEDDLAEIDAELRNDWPDPDGSPFSDWRTYESRVESLEASTIMAHPGWDEILSNAPLSKVFKPSQVAPTPADLGHLRKMYPK